MSATAETPPREIRASDRLPSWVGPILTIALAFLSAIAGASAANWGLRTDVGLILARMDAQREIDVEKAKVQDIQQKALKDTVDAVQRRQEMQQFELGKLRDEIRAINPRRFQ